MNGLGYAAHLYWFNALWERSRLPHIVAALLEQGQQPDGTIRLPDVLHRLLVEPSEVFKTSEG